MKVKKAIKTLAIAAVLTTLLVCSAFAAEGTSTKEWTSAVADCTLIHVDAAGTTPAHYHVEYKTNLVPGNQYALLVVKKDTSLLGYTVSENTIMYIDQTATSTGVSFDFIPKSTPDCIVLLGGTFKTGSSPIKLGELIGKGVQVTGSVITYNPQVKTTLELYAAGTSTAPVATTTIQAATTGYGQQTQSFTFDAVPCDTYDLWITKQGHTTYKLTGITVDVAMTLNIIPELACGDISGDGNINITDLGPLTNSGTFNKKINEATEKLADLDGSSLVNITDLGIITNIKNYNKTLTTVAYAA